MTRPSDTSRSTKSISRRGFLAVGGAAAAATALPRSAHAEQAATDKAPSIVRHRTLGRTGFKVSDLSMGGAADDGNVYRYAYDHGMNYFDTAESYNNGGSERALGEALKHMERAKVFITTKLEMKDDDTEQTILDRFAKCQERLKTEYVDALYMHSVTKLALLDHEGFHAAIARLKADGRLRHAGVSSHGPRSSGGDSMDAVLCAAAADGRFDVMLLVHNFMKKDEGEKVLACCAEHKVGTTAMKTAPGVLNVEPFDPEDPAQPYKGYLERMLEGGTERADAIKRIQGWVDEQQQAIGPTKDFMASNGIAGEDDLKSLSIKWVLSNPAMHTVCVGARDFDAINKVLPLSGTTIETSEARLLGGLHEVLDQRYCRHGCTDCLAACPHEVPVSTIMRYASYFVWQGREKHAMQRYANLDGRDASLCLDCSAPCRGACPHRLGIQANLIQAHGTLTLRA